MITRADTMVLVLAVALIGALYAYYWGERDAATTVRVTANGQADLELPLTVERRLHVHGPLGDSVIAIEGGRARFVSSPCRGQQCVHTGWLAHAGEFAACLPNGITLSIEGQDARYDGVTF